MLCTVLRSGFPVLLALLAGACTGPGFQERMKLFSSYKTSDTKFARMPAEEASNRQASLAGDARPQLETYFMCNRAAAAIVSTQRGDPASLAIAARTFCKTEDHNLQSALVAAHAEGKIYERSAKRQAMAMTTLRAARKQALENNLADIVAFRATASPTPVPSRPQGTATPKTGHEI
jgi:hypothetical protein